ncbi:unnamed protein product [Gemmataceae bacterium]|nr:unnamed protein product [Gemmataceae bacterium]VTT98943.1 unnamed protein product [Gemmataceae bacterium]
MRGMILVGLLLTGAVTVNATEEPTTGQDKKDEKFPERVSFRLWIPAQKEFLKAKDGLKAAFKDGKGGDRWVMPETPHSDPTVGSEITSTDKDGKETVWVVTKILGGVGNWVLYVTKKEPPKKD